MTAVGATNVGNISIDFDNELITNQPRRNQPLIQSEDRVFPTEGAVKKKGDHIGQFNLGSSVVLIFEAPDTFQFSCEQGQKVFYGQSLGYVL